MHPAKGDRLVRARVFPDCDNGSHVIVHYVQPRKYQLSKSLVHEIIFGDIYVM